MYLICWIFNNTLYCIEILDLTNDYWYTIQIVKLQQCRCSVCMFSYVVLLKKIK